MCYLLLVSFAKCARTPLMSSVVVSLQLAVMPVYSNNSLPSLVSLIPRANFCFLDDFVAGRFCVRNFFNRGATWMLAMA